jgi:hypothetical protein
MQNKNRIEFQGNTNFNPREQFRLSLMAILKKQLTPSTGRSLARAREGERPEAFINFVTVNIMYEIICHSATWVRFLVLAGIFILATTSKSNVGPTQPPFQLVLGLFFMVKFHVHKAHHSSLSSVKVKSEWSHSFATPYVFMTRCLILHRDGFVLQGCFTEAFVALLG